MAGLRPISTSPININACYTMDRGIVDGILRTISTSSDITTLITTTTNYKTARGIVVGILRPKSMSSITCRHSNKFIIRNTIVIMMMVRKMAGLSRLVSKTYITTLLEIYCLDVFVACNIMGVYFLNVTLRLAEKAFNVSSSGWFRPNLLVL